MFEELKGQKEHRFKKYQRTKVAMLFLRIVLNPPLFFVTMNIFKEKDSISHCMRMPQSGYFSKALKCNSGQNFICQHTKILVNILKESNDIFMCVI